ncbi:MAG: aminotransferase class IV [Mariniphaga sp.]
MCQFIETICYRNGQFQNLALHQERFDMTRSHFFGAVPELRLEQFLKIPDSLLEKTVKCRVLYGNEILRIEYNEYKISKIGSLQLVVDDSIEYPFKFADRSKINLLYQTKGQADDILIIKKGLITDTSYANIIFMKGKKWYSPQNPLLYGTRVKGYISFERVTPALLRPKDLPLFTEARIINAMISIEESPIISIENILI